MKSFFLISSGERRRSILFDSKADYLVYGMGEKAILRIAKMQNESIASRYYNTAIIEKDISSYKDALVLPSHEEVLADKKKYAEAFKFYYLEGRKKHPRIIIEPCQGRYLVVFPPENLSQKEFESLFELPFVRQPHPTYKNAKIPAWDFVKFSTVSHRGCFGGCSFCAISQHQGKYVISRSVESIKKEIKNKIMTQPDFKGNILDIGGPTSNMYGISCSDKEGCTRASCIYPVICEKLKVSQKPSLNLLAEIRQMPGIKNVFIGSGVRYDLALLDDEYIEELAKHHVSGQLSVAPEHICEEVLLMMGKPKAGKFLEFKEKFERASKKHGKKQFLIPYFVSSHPGSTLRHAYNLTLFLKKNNIRIEQVQNFTPTPMTVSTTMYYTGIDPFSGKKVHIPRGEERSFQRALLQPQLEKNRRQVAKALKQLNAKGFDL